MANTSTKSDQIRDTLRHRLRSGHVQPGNRFYSNSSLARDFGISTPTASKILDELCQEGLVHRVHGSGTFVSETAIQASVTHFAVVTWLDMANPKTLSNLGYDMVRGFERVCLGHGFRSDLINLDDPNHPETTGQLLAAKLAGVLVLPGYDKPGMAAVLARMEQADVPIVYWHDESIPPLARGPGDRVGFDNKQIGRCAAEHLLALGHRRLGFMGYTERNRWQDDRLAGFHAVLGTNGRSASERPVSLLDKEDLRPTVLTGALESLFAAGVTAIVTTNDKLAAEVLIAARAIDRRCPADYSVVGVDNREQATLINLTTVDQPPDLFARTAFDLLAERRRNPQAPPQEVLVTCPLIVRRTTGAPPA